MPQTLPTHRVDNEIARALKAGIAIDDGNVIDLLADNLTSYSLAELRMALSLSSYAGAWPRAERGKSPHKESPLITA